MSVTIFPPLPTSRSTVLVFFCLFLWFHIYPNPSLYLFILFFAISGIHSQSQHMLSLRLSDILADSDYFLIFFLCYIPLFPFFKLVFFVSNMFQKQCLQIFVLSLSKEIWCNHGVCPFFFLFGVACIWFLIATF